MEFTGPIIVLTPGRVGTRTVSATLASNGEVSIQLHDLGPSADALAIPLGNVSDAALTSKIDRVLTAEMHIRRAKLLGLQVRIISMVRDPIDRAVSEMFHREDPTSIDARCAEIGVEQVASNMSAKFGRKLPLMLSKSAAFFRDVLPLATGVSVPVYQAGAPYSVFETPYARCLFLPTERMAEFGDALSEFLGRPVDVKEAGKTKDEVAAAGVLRAALERVPSSLRLDLDRIYDQPILKAVYTTASLDAFKGRWSSSQLRAVG